ncbi:Uncharacterised protein at_DN0603, partial [Pycnogonum litorale]
MIATSLLEQNVAKLHNICIGCNVNKFERHSNCRIIRSLRFKMFNKKLETSSKKFQKEQSSNYKRSKMESTGSLSLSVCFLQTDNGHKWEQILDDNAIQGIWLLPHILRQSPVQKRFLQNVDEIMDCKTH